jgi:hypothetical protein
MKANQTWIDGGRGIKDVTRLCVTSLAVGVVVGAAMWVGIIFAAMSVVSCSHIPTLPDGWTNGVPGSITNAIPDLPGVPTTTTTTTTTTVPPVAGAYTITKVNKSGIWWSGPCPAWKDVNGCIGEVHLYYVAGANGRHEGKYDHFRKYNGSYSRDWKNIVGGYRHVIPREFRGWTVPNGGERMRQEMVSYDGKTRIVVGEFGWPTRSWWRFWE